MRRSWEWWRRREEGERERSGTSLITKCAFGFGIYLGAFEFFFFFFLGCVGLLGKRHGDLIVGEGRNKRELLRSIVGDFVYFSITFSYFFFQLVLLTFFGVVKFSLHLL